VKRRKWILAGLLLSEVIVLSLVAALLWGWFRSPVWRYRVLHTDTSLRAVLGTLRRGDSLDKVRDLLGDRHLDAESEPSVRRGLRMLVEEYPAIFLQGYDDSDIVLVYSTRTTRYGLQFRFGRLVGSCSQRGPRLSAEEEPASSRETASEGEGAGEAGPALE
jgi:hypothetical protein